MQSSAEAVDVLIIGAGSVRVLVARASYSTKCPNQSFMILESREASGGTWDLFRYPWHPL